MSYVAPRAPGPLLVLGRAAVLGAVGLGSGISSHLAGGGRLPGGLVLLVLLLGSVAVSVPMLRTWASTRRLVAVVVLAQGGWHLLLSLLAGHAGDPRGPSTTAAPVVPTELGRRTGSLHDVHLAMAPPPASSPGSGEGIVAHQVAHLGEQGVAMVLAHLAGAALLGLFLARGETSLRALAALVADSAGAALRAGAWRHLSPATPLRVVAMSGLGSAPVGRLAHDSVRRRGPPVLLAA